MILAEKAHDKANSMHEYLTMGDDYRAAAIEDMKSKWREKLKRAHDAVFESRDLYDKSVIEIKNYQQQIEELLAKCKDLEESNDVLDAEFQALHEDHKWQKSQLERLDKQKNHFDRVEAENMFIADQNKEMQVCSCRTLILLALRGSLFSSLCLSVFFLPFSFHLPHRLSSCDSLFPCSIIFFALLLSSPPILSSCHGIFPRLFFCSSRP